MDRDHVDILKAGLAAAGDIAYVWDLVDDSIAWSGTLQGVAGKDGAVTIDSGNNFHSLIKAEDLSQRLASLQQHFINGDPFDCEYRLQRNDGSYCWIHDRGQAEFDDEGVPVRMSGILRIVTTRKQAESQLEQRANYDDLTGHLNKQRLRDALQHAIEYNQRYDIHGAFLAVGIDKLSMINDAYGPETADAVIVGVAQRMERSLRVIDLIGRIGGDRFGVLLSNATQKGFAKTADKLLEIFRTNPIQTPSGPLHITISIGGVCFPGSVRTAQTAMTCAESALQEAKTRGRNCFVKYEMSTAQREQQRRNMDMGRRVLAALEDNRVVLAFQPVVSAKTLEVTYYETLLRMIDEDGKVVTAAHFVPIAEKLGLMRLLDQRALQLVVSELEEQEDIRLALNISSLTVTDRSWLRKVSALLKNRTDVARRLTVEITETAAMEDAAVFAQFVAEIKALGCRVSLDDFGAGYTSFQQMKAVPIDVVKIDGSFVRDVATNAENQLFISTLLGLAKGFGMETVAECVENEVDARVLIGMGVAMLQGWHYGRPEVVPPWRQPIVEPKLALVD